MGLPVQTRPRTSPNVARRQARGTNPRGKRAECVFTDGTSILVSNFLASFVRSGDELLFPLEFEAGGVGTQIYVRSMNPDERKQDVLQAEIG
jgi:hypothetical protein